MAVADSDRNLLLGVLALQLDFITRDDLITSLNAWVLDKAKPLGRLMIERTALNESEYKLIDALVDKHLERHRDSLELTPPAFTPTADATHQLIEKLNDPALKARLSKLSDQSTRWADISDQTGTYHRADTSSESDGLTARFQILRIHAEGGLGRVFVAKDREVDREVALKQIKDEPAATDQARARFLFEAQVTGGLEHPGIVPVYGMGHDAKGQPFYAMRLVKGTTLKQAIEDFHGKTSRVRDPGDRTIALRGLLGRFVGVCNTVAYAHSRGVLHRDLKPSNIMLGKYGETLVVDWGLAKTVVRSQSDESLDERTFHLSSGSSDQGTLPGHPVGTLEYMSPEQGTGQIDKIRFTSDIFNLGATLYCLLVGHPPYNGKTDLAILLPRIKAADFPPLRQANDEIPASLEFICQKAMRQRPDDRYASALELAGDLERWLADEPVPGYAEPISAQAGRWVRRHKPAVAAISVLLATALAGLIINNRIVRDERDRAIFAEKAAEKSRADAEVNSTLARDAVDQMLIKVAEEKLPNLPKVVQLRKKIALEAAGFYRTFLKQLPNDQSVRRKAGMIFRQVANIERMTGDSNAALTHYAEATAVFEKLVAENLKSRTDLDLLAQLEIDIAESLNMTGRYQDSIGHYTRALDLAQQLYDDAPDDPNSQRALARIQNDYGLAIFNFGQTRKGLEYCDRAVDLFARLAAREPLLAPFDPLLHLLSLVCRAPMLRESERAADAEISLELAVKLAQSLLTTYPTDARYYLAAARCEQGLTLVENQTNHSAAERLFDEAFQDLLKVNTDDPEVVYVAPKLADVQSYRERLALNWDDLRMRMPTADKPGGASRRSLPSHLRIWKSVARSRELSINWRRWPERAATLPMRNKCDISRSAIRDQSSKPSRKAREIDACSRSIAIGSKH